MEKKLQFETQEQCERIQDDGLWRKLRDVPAERRAVSVSQGRGGAGAEEGGVIKLYMIVLLIVLAGCGPSAQEKKAKSPECLAAKSQAAERRAKAESLNVEIRTRDEVMRRKLENLRLEDQLQGRPIKNRKAEALLESAIRANEIGLEHAPEQEKADEAIDQWMIQRACELPK